MPEVDKKFLEAFTAPEGRLINHALFVKDAYNEKSTAAYKIEVAIPEDDPGLVDLEEMMFDAADSYFGSGAGDREDLVLPLLNGDKLAKRRERREKDGSAYVGMTVIRAKTIYNKDGQDAAGGIQVYGPDAELILPANQREVYNGCYGIAGLTLGFYEREDDEGDKHPAMSFYLAAFQKTRDGERLATGSDRSSLFKPTVATEGGERKRRRRPRD